MIHFLKTYYQARRAAHYSRGRLHEYREDKLNALLQQAKRNVPLQNRRISVPQANRLQDIDPINKKSMMASLAASVDIRQLQRHDATPEQLQSFASNYKSIGSPIFKNFAILSETSGTSGRKAVFFRTRKELATRDAIKLAREGGKRPLRMYLRKDPLRTAVLYLGDQNTSSHQAIAELQRKFSRFTSIKKFSIDQNFDFVLQQMEDFDPHHVYSYPIYLRKLAEHVLERKLKLNPHVVRSGADLLSIEDYRVIERAFPGARIINHYAATECAPIAGTCVDNKLHLFEDCLILEAMDEDGNPVKPGEFSNHILVTSFTRSFQPIIRYRINDEVRIVPEPCTCGSIFPVLEIRGRSYITFSVRDNNSHTKTLTSMQFLAMMMELPEIEDYQVAYLKSNCFEVRVYIDGAHPVIADFSSRYGARIEAACSRFLKENNCDQNVEIRPRFLASTQRDREEPTYISFSN